jgi:hypothetical protein
MTFRAVGYLWVKIDASVAAETEQLVSLQDEGCRTSAPRLLGRCEEREFVMT